MKRALIGGFLALIGTVWGIVVLIAAAVNPASSWSTPPGRFLTTVFDAGLTVPLLLAALLLVCGLGTLAVEYFRKD